MSNGNTATEALQSECDAAIGDIRDKSGVARCEAHDALCRGVITLLRCQRAQLGQSVWWRQLVLGSIVGAMSAAAVTYLIAALGP